MTARPSCRKSSCQSSLINEKFSLFYVHTYSVSFASDKHKNEIAKPLEILNQMELIEPRFESQDSESDVRK
jgi:hypothetical protein